MKQNERNLLKKENALQINSLPLEDQALINHLMKSLGVFQVNGYDAQVIRRDLIGMAQVAGLSGSNLQEEIEDPGAFAREILRNAPGPDLAEILLSYFFWMSTMAVFYFASGTVLLYGGFFHPFSLALGGLMFFLYTCFFILSHFLSPIIPTLKKPLRLLANNAPFLLLCIYVGTQNIFLLRQGLHPVDIRPALGVCAAIALLSWLLSQWNYKRLALGKDHYVRDLLEK